MATDSLDSADASLHSLRLRLQRIEYLLAGSYSDPCDELNSLRNGSQDQSINNRLVALERALNHVVTKSKTIKELLHLHTNFPELFRNTPAAALSHSTLSTSEKATVVLSKAPEYHAASSQLTSVMDTPVPDPAAMAAFVALLPRIQRAELVQLEQDRKLAELRRRSSLLLERWFSVGVEGVNECFAEWEERTFEVYKQLAQVQKRREEEEVGS